MIYLAGVTSQTVDLGIYDDAGLPVTGLVAATFPTLTYSLAGPNADVAFPSLTDLALITTAYASGGVKERGNGVYRVDVPDGAFTTAGAVTIRGDATNKHVVMLHPVEVFSATRGTAGTALPAAAANAANGLPVSIAGGLDLDEMNADIEAIQTGVNVTSINSVSTSSVTTINANVGTTQAAQYDANNLPKVDVVDLIGTALTESGAGQLAAAFKKLFDVAAPVLTAASVNQTGDGYGIVNSATFGNAKLVRATVPGTTLDTSSVAQTGDGYVIVNSGTYGNAALNTNIGTLQTSVNNLNNLSALANLFAPSTLVRPSSSSIVYPLTFVVKDSEGHLVDVDTNTVTLTAANTAGTDRSANLSAVTHAGTGEYTFSYTVASSHADEGLRITASGTVQSATRKAYANCDVADADSLSSLAAIQAQTDKLVFDGSNYLKVDLEHVAAAALDSTTAQIGVNLVTVKTQGVTLTGALDLDDLVADVDATETRVALSLPAFAPQAAGGLITSAAGSLDVDEMNADIEAIQAKTDNLPASPAATGAAMTLTASGLDAILIEAGIVAGVLLVNDSGGQLTSINPRQALALILAAACGKDTGGGTGAIAFKPAGLPAAATPRILTSGADANGNRGTITLTVPN